MFLPTGSPTLAFFLDLNIRAGHFNPIQENVRALQKVCVGLSMIMMGVTVGNKLSYRILQLRGKIGKK